MTSTSTSPPQAASAPSAPPSPSPAFDIFVALAAFPASGRPGVSTRVVQEPPERTGSVGPRSDRKMAAACPSLPSLPLRLRRSPAGDDVRIGSHAHVMMIASSSKPQLRRPRVGCPPLRAPPLDLPSVMMSFCAPRQKLMRCASGRAELRRALSPAASPRRPGRRHRPWQSRLDDRRGGVAPCGAVARIGPQRDASNRMLLPQGSRSIT